MGHITKPLKVTPALTGTVLDGETVQVDFPIGVEYFAISVDEGGGDLHWAWKAADIAADKYQWVGAGEKSDNIVANPLSLAFKAVDGDVDYHVFVVVEGR